MLDVVVVGGGPAGLSAALMLGRCRRRVLVCDDGAPRNVRARALHGYLTRDGTPPLELLRLGCEELRPYGVEFRAAPVSRIARLAGGFEVHLADGRTERARFVLLATGVQDILPVIPGIEECYGRSVHHCPYCDGWEWRDRQLGVYGRGRSGARTALALQTWSRNVTLFTDGPGRLSRDSVAHLEGEGVHIEQAAVAELQHEHGMLRQVVLATGRTSACDALFFTTGQHARSTLAHDLGCEFTARGTVKTDRHGATCVPGIFVVGDASRDVQFVIVAASEGAKAAVGINKLLQAPHVKALPEG